MRNILGTALLALTGSIVLAESKPSAPTLYCLSDPASSSITTLDPLLPKVKCFRVQDGLFTEVLTEAPNLKAEEVTFLDGHVLPGIIESHGHILQYGEMLESVSLYGSESLEEVRRRIKEFLKVHAGEGYGSREKWVRGIGWDQAFFGGVMPTAVSFEQTSHLYLRS